MIDEEDLDRWVAQENLNALMLRLRVASVSPEIAVTRFGKTVSFWERFATCSVETLTDMAQVPMSLVHINIDPLDLIVANRGTARDLDQFMAARIKEL